MNIKDIVELAKVYIEQGAEETEAIKIATQVIQEQDILQYEV